MSSRDITRTEEHAFLSTQKAENEPSKFKVLGFAVLIIFGVGGVVVADIGTGGLLHAGSLTNLGQVNSIIMIVIGGAGGIPLLVIGIVGFVNTRSGSSSRISEKAAVQDTKQSTLDESKDTEHEQEGLKKANEEKRAREEERIRQQEEQERKNRAEAEKKAREEEIAFKQKEELEAKKVQEEKKATELEEEQEGAEKLEAIRQHEEQEKKNRGAADKKAKEEKDALQQHEVELNAKAVDQEHKSQELLTQKSLKTNELLRKNGAETLQNPSNPDQPPSLLEIEGKLDLAKPVKRMLYIDEDLSLSKEEKIEKLREALKTHKPHFSSECVQKNHPPSIDLPYAHFTVPLQVGDLFFDMEPKSLGATKNGENQWDTLLRFNYLGQKFEAFITTYWFLETITGNIRIFAPSAFQVAYRNWKSSFEVWNTNTRKQQIYFTCDDLRLIGKMQIQRDRVVISDIECEMRDKSDKFSYYLPDYTDHELVEDQKYLKITRSQPSCLVDIEHLEYISEDMRLKIHTQTCLIPLPKGFSGQLEISYNKETRNLILVIPKD